MIIKHDIPRADCCERHRWFINLSLGLFLTFLSTTVVCLFFNVLIYYMVLFCLFLTGDIYFGRVQHKLDTETGSWHQWPCQVSLFKKTFLYSWHFIFSAAVCWCQNVERDYFSWTMASVRSITQPGNIIMISVCDWEITFYLCFWRLWKWVIVIY